MEDTETGHGESGGISKLHHDKQEKAAGYSQRDKVVGISQRGEVVGKVDVTRGMQSSQLVDSGDGERSERTRGVDLVRVERRCAKTGRPASGGGRVVLVWCWVFA